MMKLLLIILLIVGCSLAQNTTIDTTSIMEHEIITNDSLNWNYVAQASMIVIPIITKAKKNNDGNIVGVNGLMLFPTGWYSKNYYKPLEVDAWNPFWIWGTIAIIPYYGIGTEYINSNGFFFGVGTVYAAPLIHFGKYF